jgi:hypothetical protein
LFVRESNEKHRREISGAVKTESRYVTRLRFSSILEASDVTRLHFLSLLGKKIMVFPPSSRRQATVHRTVAFLSSSHISIFQKRAGPFGPTLFWS